MNFGKWSTTRKLSLLLCITVLCCMAREIFHVNKGFSAIYGTRSNGSIQNAHLVPFRGKNFKYASPVSYYLMDNGYTSDRVVKTLIDAFAELETTAPKKYFRIMECSNKKGGKLLFHRTHRNGVSVDLMIPKKFQSGKQSRFLDRLGALFA